MTAAELAVEDHRAGDAIAAIETLQAAGPRHIHALRIALRAYEQSGDWRAAIHALRQIEKRSALHPAAVRGLKIRAYRALFAARRDDPGACSSCMRRSRPPTATSTRSSRLPRRPSLRQGDRSRAARIVEQALELRLVVPLVSLYAQLEAVPARERLRRAEAWRGRYGDDPVLLRALGRLCAAQGLWGKAEEFLVLAAGMAPDRETHLLLAQPTSGSGRAGEATSTTAWPRSPAPRRRRLRRLRPSCPTRPEGRCAARRAPIRGAARWSSTS